MASNMNFLRHYGGIALLVGGSFYLYLKNVLKKLGRGLSMKKKGGGD